MRISRALLPLLVLVFPACSGDGTGTPPPPAGLTVQVSGRAERGLVVTAAVTRQGTAVDPATVQWSSEPAGAVEVVEAGRLKLLREGSVKVVATSGESTGNATLSVAVPPSVVFDRVAENNRDIWRVALDGGGLARLTTHAGDDQDPSVAGSTVVFTSFRAGGRGDLYAVSVTGADERRVTTTAGANETSPALSPDGQRLAYISDASGVPKVWTSAASGAGAARALDASFGFPGSLEASPAWAPTGNRFVFVATSNGSADIFSVTLPGSPAIVSATDSAEIEPAWSPDGTRVAFASRREGDTELYVLTLSSGALVRLTQRAGTDSQPAWTTDGRIVYTAFSGSPAAPRLFWLDPASPAETHEIPTGTGAAQRPSVIP